MDADDTAVGAPFPVGSGVKLRVPESAVAIALGLNSKTFTINRGGYDPLITARLPNVTVKPARQ